MFGLTFEKLLIIGVIAAFIIGPERLPMAAEKLRSFVRWARDAAGGAKERLREEMGEDFDDVDWRKLDPRQYDPRRIIRDALLEDPAPPSTSAPKALSSGDRAATPHPIDTDVPSSAATAGIAGPAVAAGLAASAAVAGAAAGASRPDWASNATVAAAAPDAAGEPGASGTPLSLDTPFDTEAT